MKGIISAIWSAGIQKLGNFVRHDLKNPLDMTVKLADKALDNSVKAFTVASDNKENMDKNIDEI